MDYLLLNREKVFEYVMEDSCNNNIASITL
jgi:hypothetical protein